MREKMKGMSLLQKIDYLWTYYKIWLLVPIIIGCVVYVGFSAYRAKHQNVLVNTVIVGSTMANPSELQESLKSYMKSESKNDVVTIMTNIPDDNMGMTSTTALGTMIGAGSVDVIVGPESVYQYLGGEEADLLSAEELMGEQYDEKMPENAIVLEGEAFLKEKLGVPYDKAYIMVLGNAAHREGAVKFVQFVLKNL